MTKRAAMLTALVTVCLATSGGAQSDRQAANRSGDLYRSPGGTTLRLMLDDSNIGPDVAVGEITFPANSDSGEHTHDAIEIFYVISGELEHVVNGRSQMLKPGMAGFVRPPDKVRHKTGAAPVQAVVMWMPGAEAKKIAARWTKEP